MPPLIPALGGGTRLPIDPGKSRGDEERLLGLPEFVVPLVFRHGCTSNRSEISQRPPLGGPSLKDIRRRQHSGADSSLRQPAFGFFDLTGR